MPLYQCIPASEIPLQSTVQPQIVLVVINLFVDSTLFQVKQSHHTSGHAESDDDDDVPLVSYFIQITKSEQVDLIITVVTEMLCCWVNTTSSQGTKQRGVSFAFIFLLFSFQSSWGPRLQQPEETPGPCLLMTALDYF